MTYFIEEAEVLSDFSQRCIFLNLPGTEVPGKNYPDFPVQEEKVLSVTGIVMSRVTKIDFSLNYFPNFLFLGNS